MNRFHKIVEKSSNMLDNIACFGIALTMVLVVVNVLLRSIFNSPIKGVYEYTGYFTALVIGFTIARCAAEGAHIAVDFIMEKLNPKIQLVFDRVFGILTVIFLVFSSIQVLLYGISVIKSGEVSQTAHIAFYPFIFGVSAGLFALCLVETSKLFKGGAKK